MRSLHHSARSFFLLLFVFELLSLVTCQDCSATKLCATGCCSQYGFCGTDTAHCGAGCLSTCDFKLGCDANNPCADGTCCSSFGFCGLGPDYCSPKNCVNGCDAKAYCDPGGYGDAYVNVTECPLNVCCSQWGYCGTTEEFCGTKTVNRPSCPNKNPIQRVLGYYEGWAATRNCQAFFPEDIPAGVYTHLNYAFAGIDPNTFEIVPASAEDVGLYSRLTALKQTDESLKVFVSIGGWDFNNVGPTATTFSDLAASTANQQKFFVSLISFMSTYDFDGVDIDWEYPGASDRSGRPEDLANYPTFLKNLKAALQSNGGGRDGLTITVPVSYWYLQNFDIVNLEPWVDWFNVMSYDLHGLWDKGNKWLGPYLNSHTNLTEITEYMDLFWRNTINPSKINLGLAFYSRTFVASDPNCLEPACTFDAVGDPGPCTNSLGTLSNAELTDKKTQAGATSVLNQAAAVKILTIGQEWITYDDADSWALKVDFARSQCMGGLMVWAVSEDYNNGTYSYQLQTATEYSSPSVFVEKSTTGGKPVTVPNPQVLRNQCLWANCGQSCPSGYTTVPRKDSGAKRNEVMQDATFCHGGQVRVYCCPANAVIPGCGWYDFNNGKCGQSHNSVCPAGSTYASQVGSYNGACGNKKTSFEVACCESDSTITSSLGYGDCVWEGTPKDCGHVVGCQTTGAQTELLLRSAQGSGAEYCDLLGLDGSVSVSGYPRNYCCNPPALGNEWTSCTKVVPIPNDDGTCDAYCPDGTVKLGMENYGVGYGSVRCKGGWAQCCTPDFRTQGSGSADSDTVYTEALQYVLANGCDWATIDAPLAARNIDALVPALRARGGPDATYLCQVALANTLNMFLNVRSYTGHQEAVIFDGVMASAGLNNIHASSLVADATYGSEPGPVQTAIVEGTLNSLQSIDETAPLPDDDPLCPLPIWTLDLPATWDEDDGGEDDEIPSLKMRRSMSQDLENQPEHDLLFERITAGLNELDERAGTGSPRSFWVTSKDNNRLLVKSSPYPNGNGGDDLLSKTNDTHRYIPQSLGCGPTDYSLNIKAAKLTSNKWVSEHILELQTLPRFLTAILDGTFPAVVSASLPATDIEDLSYEAAKAFSSYYLLPDVTLPIPASEVLAYFGSVKYPIDMVVADSFLNSIKSRIYRFVKPVSDPGWASCCAGGTYAQANKAMSYIQTVLAIFDYYDSDDVKARHSYAYANAKNVMAVFENDYSTKKNVDIRGHMQDLWAVYMRGHFARVTEYARWWTMGKLDSLLTVWTAQLARSSTYTEMLFAQKMIDLIDLYIDGINAGTKIYFDDSFFY